MWYSAVQSEFGKSVTVDEVAAKGVIERYRAANPGLSLTANKQNLIVSVLTKVPEPAIVIFMAHLQERTWERSGLNQQLLGLRELTADFVPSGCAGLWVNYLRNSPESCADIARFICAHFLEKVPQPESNAKKSDITGARIKVEEVVALQAASALYHKWLRKEIMDREPWASELVQNAWDNRSLVADLYRITQAKVSAATAQKLTYLGIGSLMALLRQQKAVSGPMSGENKRKRDEGKRAEFLALKVKIDRVQQDFVEHIESACAKLMDIALQRMDVMNQNGDRYAKVCAEFCHLHVRIVALNGPMTATSTMSDFLTSVRSLWPSLHELPCIYIMNLADVPFPRVVSEKDLKAARAMLESVGEDDERVGTGDVKAEKGTKQEWNQLLGMAAAQVLSSPHHSMLLLVHALRAPKQVGALPMYNMEFIKTLVEVRLNVDMEILLGWDKDSSGRPPRRVTLAMKGGVRNVFEGGNGTNCIIPASGVIVLPKAKGPEGDFMKVQNVLAIRETDVADSSNLSSAERMAILGSSSLKALIHLAKASVVNLSAFKAELAKGSCTKRRTTRAKKEEPHDDAAGPVKDEEDGTEPEQEEEEPSAVETPAKKHAPAQPAAAKNTPMVVIVLGVANGNVATAAADAAMESGKTIHTLIMDLSKTACEFAQSRVEKKVYSDWHAGKLEWNNVVPLKIRSQERDGQLQFDASPLTIRNGRLRIPDALLEEFIEDEATQEMVEELKADHAARFHTGEHTLAKLDLAKQGVRGGPGSADASTELPDPPCHTGDPTDAAGVALLPKAHVAVSMCEKFKICVSTAGVFVLAQTSVAVLPGERIGEFGSGGFRTPAEIQDLNAEGCCLKVVPVLRNDMDEVLLLADDAGSSNTKPNTTSYLAFQTMIAKLLEEGTVSWPFQVLFHNVTCEKPKKASGERTRFTVTCTNEKTWVTLAKKTKSPDGDKTKITWASVFKHVVDVDALKNNLVKIVWQVRVVPQLGLVRLERPCVVWAKPFELKTGTVLRIG